MDKNTAMQIWGNFTDEAYYLKKKAKRLEDVSQYIIGNYEFLDEDSFWILVKEALDSATVYERDADDIIKEAEARYN